MLLVLWSHVLLCWICQTEPNPGVWFISMHKSLSNTNQYSASVKVMSVFWLISCIQTSEQGSNTLRITDKKKNWLLSKWLLKTISRGTLNNLPQRQDSLKSFQSGFSSSLPSVIVTAPLRLYLGYLSSVWHEVNGHREHPPPDLIRAILMAKTNSINLTGEKGNSARPRWNIYRWDLHALQGSGHQEKRWGWEKEGIEGRSRRRCGVNNLVYTRWIMKIGVE